MAQWNRQSQSYLHDNTTLFEASLAVDEYGNPIKAQSASSVSAFGEGVSVPISPVFQLDGLYGLDDRLFDTNELNGGVVESTGTLMKCSSGVNLNALAQINSKRSVRYRPGQGAMARFTSQFTAGVDGYTQRSGFISEEQAVQIGYDGENFGILLQNGGKAHIETFDIWGPATSNGDITITLDGVNYPITLVNGDSISTIVAKIKDGITSTDWSIEYNATTVSILANEVGPKSGAFAFSDTGGTSVTSTNTTVQLGMPHIENWVYQQDFNLDTLDGTGFSGAVIDPTKLNVYQINFRWLGAGEIRFAFENPSNGDIINFHEIRYTNRHNDVHLDNPSLKIGHVVKSIGGSGTDVSVSGASMMGAIEGLIKTTKLPTAVGVSYDPNPNSLADEYHHILTLHNRLIFNDKINTREFILKNVNAAFKTNPEGVPVLVYVYSNFEGLPLLEYDSQEEDKSSIYHSTTQGIVTTEVEDNLPIYIFEIPGGGSAQVNLEDLRIAIPPNNSISFVATSTEKLAKVSLSAIWLED